MPRRTFLKLASLAGSGIAAGKLLGEFPLSAQASPQVPPLPPPAPIPDLPPKRPAGSVPMGNPTTFPEAKMDFPIVPGPYAPTWESIAQNYPGKEVSWLRDAKFGIWVHFGPQAAGMSGDWYARRLYMQGQTAYNNHIRDFGHPSEIGYKDLLKDWNPTKLDPAAVVKLYKNIGARFMLIQGVHHDNFDNWNSTYQPWNSMNMGPKRDLLGEWSQAAHKAGMRFGVSFHHEYTWWWWLKSLGSDRTGPKAGVPYDGNLTLADGKGKWWEGLDPRLLYGVDLREYQGFDQDSSCPVQGIVTNHPEYCKWYVTRWALRIMDVVRKYDPDFIYTDGNSTQPFTGFKSATGYKCDAMQRVMADFYNHSLLTRGKVDTFSIVKFHPPGNGVVNTFENNWPADIKTDQPWIGETAYGDGSLDDGSLKLLADVGDWMKVNGEAIYGSRAWVKLGESADGRPRPSPTGKIGGRQAGFKFGPQDFRFTEGKDGSVYAFCLTVPDPATALKITSLGTDAQPGRPAVKSVSLLGSTAPLDWKQQADGLQIKCPDPMPFHIALVFKVNLAAA
ncbi:MAG: alpha-L-fucosidase [Verrucomicrobiota bacterium]